MQSWQNTGRSWHQVSTHSSISTCSATAWTWCAPHRSANLSTANVCTSTLLHDGVLACSWELSFIINCKRSCISNLIIKQRVVQAVDGAKNRISECSVQRVPQSPNGNPYGNAFKAVSQTLSHEGESKRPQVAPGGSWRIENAEGPPSCLSV